jgi:hypothetical protein
MLDLLVPDAPVVGTHAIQVQAVGVRDGKIVALTLPEALSG